MNPNPGTTRRALARGAPTELCGPAGARRSGARVRGILSSLSLPGPQGGASRGGASRRPTRELSCSSGMQPRPLPPEPGAAGGVRRPSLCQGEPRPLSGGTTPLSVEAPPIREKPRLLVPPLAGNCSARSRQELAPASRDLLSLSSVETVLAFRKPQGPAPWSPRPL